MIDSQKVLYSPGSNDEMMTPRHAVEPLIKHIAEYAQGHSIVVWSPFDTKDSYFYKVLSETGRITVITSHISEGQDFYTYEPPEWDIMISNPPFTNKRKIFERALSFGKPFALLMSNTWLNDAAPAQLFIEKELQLLMFDKRIHYDNQKKITFSSSYYCWNFLPKQIIMERLKIWPIKT